jgi:hypothetical protein
VTSISVIISNDTERGRVQSSGKENTESEQLEFEEVDGR